MKEFKVEQNYDKSDVIKYRAFIRRNKELECREQYKGREFSQNYSNAYRFEVIISIIIAFCITFSIYSFFPRFPNLQPLFDYVWGLENRAVYLRWLYWWLSRFFKYMPLTIFIFYWIFDLLEYISGNWATMEAFRVIDKSAKEIYLIKNEKKQLESFIKTENRKYGRDPRNLYEKFLDDLNGFGQKLKYYIK